MLECGDFFLTDVKSYFKFVNTWLERCGVIEDLVDILLGPMQTSCSASKVIEDAGK